MGDLILAAGIGHPGADPRPVLVQAVFRTTLLVYGGICAWRALLHAHRLHTVLKASTGSVNTMMERVDRVGRQVSLLQGNVAALAALAVYEVAAWMAAVWWPEWRVLPVVCNEVPVACLYLYILACIRVDLL